MNHRAVKISSAKKPTFLGLFSGCGGFDLGFINAGFQPKAAYDIWPLAVENYKKNIGKHAVVFDLAGGYLPKAVSCDVVVAGSPCQGFSSAGKRAIDDPRNFLLQAAVNIALAVKPKAVVLENVPGMLQGSHRQHWNMACDKLRAGGYKIDTLMVDARQFGLPQARKRVIVIAWNTDIEELPPLNEVPLRSIDDILKGASDCANHEPQILVPGSDEYKIASKILPGQKLCNVRGGDAAVHSWDLPDVFGPTTANEREILIAVMRLRRQIRVRTYGDADPVAIKDVYRQLKRKVVGDISNLVSKGYLQQSGNMVDLKNTFNGKYRRPIPSGVANTVDTRFGDPRCFLHPRQNRGFSVREAARIQGFPDSFLFHGSRSDQYKMVANAVPPQIGYAVGKMLLSVL